MKPTRRFCLGEEWLYYKIYASVGIQEELLKDKLFDLAYELYADQLIDNFFFVRYIDLDGPHLRLRYHVPEMSNLVLIITKFNSKLKLMLASRIIAKIITDTYVRELERYGTKNIQGVEKIFGMNSLFILNLLRSDLSQVGQMPIWLPMIARLDKMLNHLSFSSNDKHKIYEELYVYFALRHNNNARNKEQLKKKYRENRYLIHEAITKEITIKVKKCDPVNIGSEHILLCKTLGEGKTKSEKAKNNQILKDLIHMSFNRLFSHEQNLIEYVTYYMMSNYYKSVHMRESISN